MLPRIGALQKLTSKYRKALKNVDVFRHRMDWDEAQDEMGLGNKEGEMDCANEGDK